MSAKQISAWLKTFERKNSEEIEAKGVLVEITSVQKDGTIEIQFSDRNEDCYLRFTLSELIEQVLQLAGDAE